MSKPHYLVENERSRVGMSGVTATARRLHQALVNGGYAYKIVGGYAVQEYGYVRYTSDVDAVVRDRGDVARYLTATGLFKRVPGSEMTLVDNMNGVRVDLLPAGRADHVGAVPYPDPGTAGHDGLQFVTLPELINLKLGAKRVKDDADVVELIKVNRLWDTDPLPVPAELQARYDNLMTVAKAEHAAESSKGDLAL